MKLLITNDDGVFAPGLITLASFLADRGEELTDGGIFFSSP